nr:GNAT family N-acetyltransferase [Clostridium chromiireducens]
MMEIIAYEMQFTSKAVQETDIKLEVFKDEFYPQYEKVYNQCFFDMRKALEIEPYNFYSGIEKLDDKKKNIYVLWNDNTVIGSVACYGNEIDDLIVNKSYQNKGVGKKLLLWSIKHIRNKNDKPIILHVAKWNEKALKLYLDNGFEISRIEKVR